MKNPASKHQPYEASDLHEPAAQGDGTVTKMAPTTRTEDSDSRSEELPSAHATDNTLNHAYMAGVTALFRDEDK